MDINSIIEKNYKALWKEVQDFTRAIEAKTDDDLFQDAMLRTLKRFQGKDCEEETAVEYFRKSFLTEAKLKNKKIVSGKLFIEDIEGFDSMY